ncbi:MAG: FAD-dependent oxidoreductase [Oscillospiraceae bacterium]|nr:FAD-dependent oxidoreductase [Oscillospiraceae bacterium]
MEYRKYIADKLPMKWPYPIAYDKETRENCDVLIIGGGLAGAFAAITAAKRGARVVVLDKGAIVRSGAAGVGIDHWGGVHTAPGSKYAPDEVIRAPSRDNYAPGHTKYIAIKEAYDALLELEEYGLKIRDEDDEFLGAPFRDDETKLMFAYDYESKHTIRIPGGEQIKVVLYNQMKRLGIKMYDRVHTTSLLTKDAARGARVVGATGVNIRTGEFYVMSAKTTILSTGCPLRLWEFATELVGSNAHHDDPNCAGDGNVLAWRAGAQLMMMDKSHSSSGGRRYPAYMTANADNTWRPCTIVDADGKEIPWQNRDGVICETFDDRNKLASGQKMMASGGQRSPYELRTPTIIYDLKERIESGEYKLPFYADMTQMPDDERRVLFGVMLGNEGKTRVPVLETLQNAGFDPEQDMLQANVLPPQYMGTDEPWWDVKSPGIGGHNIRDTAFIGYGGLVVDWNMRCSLEGLYAAGNQVAGVTGAPSAAATGRYAARNAVEYAKTAEQFPVSEAQVAYEKQRVLSFVNRDKGYGWKEVQLGLCRIMQDYCGDYRSKEVMEMGLWWLNSIRENELANTVASNPHDLGKVLDVDTRLAIGEIMLHQSLSREFSSKSMGVVRLDFPKDGDDCGYYQTLNLKGDEIEVGKLPFNYWLENGDYNEAYEKNCCL